MVETDKERCLDGILKEIDGLKAKGKRSLYRINAKITDGVAKHVEAYFRHKPNYSIDMRKCSSCAHSWDIIITFTLVEGEV